MNPETQIRLRCLELALEQTAGGVKWEQIIETAGKFDKYVLDKTTPSVPPGPPNPPNPKENRPYG